MASGSTIQITDTSIDISNCGEIVDEQIGFDTRRFIIKYAGLVPEISCDIDPSGRTDLLKILDDAKIHGHIDSTTDDYYNSCGVNGVGGKFQENARIEINYDAVTVHSLYDSTNNDIDTHALAGNDANDTQAAEEEVEEEDASLLLVVPLHMLASIGVVHDATRGGLSIVPMKIGEIDGGGVDIFNLAVFYARTPQIADQIYSHLAECFQFVYRESLSQMDDSYNSSEKFITVQSSSSSTTSHVTHESGFEARKQLCPTASTSTSDSTKNTMDLINDYVTMLSACLTHEELNKFAVLMRRWRAKEMPILEFAQKLMELYGIERKHLLARMKTLLRGVSREELNALSNFLQANGITEDATAGGGSGGATSGLSPRNWAVCEMSLSATTDDDANARSPSLQPLDSISRCSGV